MTLSQYRLSVIVCAHNEARFLPACLHSLLAQTRVPDEIVVRHRRFETRDRDSLTTVRGMALVTITDHDESTNGEQVASPSAEK